jgi:hypothetical protein
MPAARLRPGHHRPVLLHTRGDSYRHSYARRRDSVNAVMAAPVSPSLHGAERFVARSRRIAWSFSRSARYRGSAGPRPNASTMTHVGDRRDPCRANSSASPSSATVRHDRHGLCAAPEHLRGSCSPTPGRRLENLEHVLPKSSRSRRTRAEERLAPRTRRRAQPVGQSHANDFLFTQKRRLYCPHGEIWVCSRGGNRCIAGDGGLISRQPGRFSLSDPVITAATCNVAAPRPGARARHPGAQRSSESWHSPGLTRSLAVPPGLNR